MKAVNLYLLTTSEDPELISLALQALSEYEDRKPVSPHEAASLCAFTKLAVRNLKAGADPGSDWIDCLDGFFFSYVIEHIGKEFDLLKISRDGEYVLNVELKSEDIGEERIKKQLEQNRYYLSHTARTIYSFTFVMSTGTLYNLNSRGYLQTCPFDNLIRILKKSTLRDYLEEGIDRFFRSSDYLISPVAMPEKFLMRQYFLTNQQEDFKRRILLQLKQDPLSLITVKGITGTGKTLLLFDVAMELSKKRRVLLLHAGMLRKGHYIIDERLKNVDIRSADDRAHIPDLSNYSCLIIDEADYLRAEELQIYLEMAEKAGLPVLMSYDPHQLLDEQISRAEETETIRMINHVSTLLLTFSGNIRINRPVYAFLRTLLNLKDYSGRQDYSCIDVLYAADREECALMTQHYMSKGYLKISDTASYGAEERIIAQEYRSVIMVLDESFYYDDTLRLCAASSETADDPIRVIYESLSRTRERLCLIITGNQELYARILAVRLHRPR